MTKQNEETFECYYRNKFSSTFNEEEYLKHVVLTHNNKPVYPSMTDLENNNFKPQGRYWEI